MQKNQILFITSLIFAIFVTIFAVTNAEPVQVNLFFYKFEASQALVIFISAALGAISVISMGLMKELRFKREMKNLVNTNEQLRKRLEEVETELEKKSQSTNTAKEDVI